MKRLMILLLPVSALTTTSTALTAQPTDAMARTIEITYCRGLIEVGPRCSIQQVVREHSGILSVNTGGQIETGTWTYDRPTKTLTMYFDNYPTVVHTNQMRRGCFRGTMTGPYLDRGGRLLHPLRPSSACGAHPVTHQGRATG